MIEYKVKVYNDERKEWFLNDQLHRIDGPAIEYPDETKYWYFNDELHREDGPAVEYPDGTKKWYLNDKQLTEQEFLVATQPTKELTVKQISELLGYEVKIIKE